jgi:hypothetical protein
VPAGHDAGDEAEDQPQRQGQAGQQERVTPLVQGCRSLLSAGD